MTLSDFHFPSLPLLQTCRSTCDKGRYQEYIIEREGEYPTPVYPSVVSLDRGHDLYNIIHTYHSGPRGGGF